MEGFRKAAVARDQWLIGKDGELLFQWILFSGMGTPLSGNSLAAKENGLRLGTNRSPGFWLGSGRPSLLVPCGREQAKAQSDRKTRHQGQLSCT
jgi:hypothetical protein